MNRRGRLSLEAAALDFFGSIVRPKRGTLSTGRDDE